MKPRLAVPVKFKKLHEKAVIPQYQTHGAACVDLVVTEIDYEDEDKVTLKFGFSTEIPDGYKVFVMPRSSFTHKGWVMQNSPGVIDSDFRGEWKVRFQAIPQGIKLDKFTGLPLGFIYDDCPYKVGDRAVQASVEVNIHMRMIPLKKEEELGITVRGEGGFGHTGK